jgi:hypothetical protein
MRMAEPETEADLQQLCDNEVAEGILIDYKRDLYGRSDQEKKEFLKDVHHSRILPAVTLSLECLSRVECRTGYPVCKLISMLKNNDMKVCFEIGWSREFLEQ